MSSELRGELVSICVMTGLLGLTGAGLFGWMASSGWQDKPGVVIGIIFLILTGMQVLLTILWWRMNKKHNVYCRQDDVVGEAGIPMVTKTAQLEGADVAAAGNVEVEKTEEKV